MLTADYDVLGLKSGEKILDVGCGFGRHAYEAARRGAQVVTLDAGREEVEGVLGTLALMIEAGELSRDAKVAVIQGDALHLPFPDNHFDHVICSEVLEHIPEDSAAMAELVRVLRPGGTMAVTIPRFFPELINWALSDEYHMVKGGHVRIYRRSVVESRLIDAGVKVTGHAYAHGLHSPYWWLKCAVGTTNDTHWAVKAYHRLLVWDIVKGPWLTRTAEKILSPLMGKSMIVYSVKPA